MIARVAPTLLVLVLLASPGAAGDFSEVPIADAHLHLLDFLQNGEYLEDGAIVPREEGITLEPGYTYPETRFVRFPAEGQPR